MKLRVNKNILLLFLLVFSFGFVFRDILEFTRIYGYPKEIKNFKGNIINISVPPVERNQILSNFYLAWKNQSNLTGIVQESASFDSASLVYYLIENGEITFVCIPLRCSFWDFTHGWKDCYVVKKIADLDIGYYDTDGSFIEIDPEKETFYDLQLQPHFY